MRDSNTGFTFFNVQGHQSRLRRGVRNRLPSRMANWSFQKSLPRHSAVRLTLVQLQEQSPSERQCSRFKSINW